MSGRRWITALGLSLALVLWPAAGTRAAEESAVVEKSVVTQGSRVIWVSPFLAGQEEQQKRLQQQLDDGELVGSSQESGVLTSVDAAAAVVRQGMRERAGEITLVLEVPRDPSLDPEVQADLLAGDFKARATDHTGKGDEGDSLSGSLLMVTEDKDFSVQGDTLHATYTYHLGYFDTAEEERQTVQREQEILSELQLEGMDDLHKVLAIYNYICSHVTYDDEGAADETNFHCHTAYSAMVEQHSVCQGFALMFYRLCCDSGVDARYITGETPAGRHAWNTARVGDRYYLFDTTLDAGQEPKGYGYLLRGSKDFPDHQTDEYALEKAFTGGLPYSEENYSGLLVSSPSLSLAVGRRDMLRGISPAGRVDQDALHWESADPSVATVDEYGWVIGVRAGTTRITVTDAQGRTDSCEVRVHAFVPASALTISPQRLTMIAGEQQRAPAVSLLPANTDDTGVSWSSSDDTIAMVDPMGFLQARGAGTAEVAATSDVGGARGSCTVSVFFADVPEGAYYREAVQWALDQDITRGVTPEDFGPQRTCTRAQIVTFLYRAAGSPKVSGSLPFTDVKKGSYYYRAVLWAKQKGITSGKSKTRFAPNDPCTRGQIMTFLWKEKGSPQESTAVSFSDVNSRAYYAPAVRWAVKNGITAGKTKTLFGSSDPCTRAQAVTFLYRSR